MSNDLPLIIVNPRSGRRTTERDWASIASQIRTHFGPFECEFTRGPGDAISIAEEATRKERKLVIACGGDGTISEVANGILRAGGNCDLGVLPRGTGGDFRRTLKIPASIPQASRRLKEGKTHRMDAGLLHYIDRTGNEAVRYFINTASFGMSGKVASHANKSDKRLGGAITYAAATLKTIFSYSFPDIVLQIDDQSAKRLRIVTICVANGPSFGGGMRIAPGAKLNDGFFDVVIIGDMKTTRIVMNSYRLYTGSFLSMDRVKHLPARKVHAAPADPETEILLEVDGETPGRLPATFEILPQALQIRC